MEIKLDLDNLQRWNLTPSQYVFLRFVYENKLLPGYLLCQLNTADLGHLQGLGYIKVLPDLEDGYNRVYLRQKGIDLFEVEHLEAKWLEFKANYPIKSGERRLHGNQEDCKKKYLKLVRDLGTHEMIMTGLKNEQKARIRAAEKREFFPDWKLMLSWINGKCWLTYLDYRPEGEEQQMEERL